MSKWFRVLIITLIILMIPALLVQSFVPGSLLTIIMGIKIVMFVLIAILLFYYIMPKNV
ncbi:hypothetical protein [Staphylococcus massiliensis]|uniref:hypothetical protein n=1 Tax=Staphylococcus massiliensis TaxID=555791 RepID=UPI0002D84542|nr:hypothetical protein [Staphylococcus massiliensis]MCG3402208.1 hypothetical protein [Staphylococcus massiliensis]MCG3412825.1 hypothetical protein [Staphylococcus massiliensis]